MDSLGQSIPVDDTKLDQNASTATTTTTTTATTTTTVDPKTPPKVLPLEVITQLSPEEFERMQNKELVKTPTLTTKSLREESLSCTPPHLKNFNRVEFNENQTETTANVDQSWTKAVPEPNILPIKTVTQMSAEKFERLQNLEAVSANQSIAQSANSTMNAKSNQTLSSFSVTPPNLKNYDREENTINQTEMYANVDQSVDYAETTAADSSDIPSLINESKITGQDKEVAGIFNFGKIDDISWTKAVTKKPSILPINVVTQMSAEEFERLQNPEAVSVNQSIAQLANSAMNAKSDQTLSSFSVTPPNLKNYDRVEYSINQTNMTEANAQDSSMPNLIDASIRDQETIFHIGNNFNKSHLHHRKLVK